MTKIKSIVVIVLLFTLSNLDAQNCSEYILKFGNDKMGDYTRDIQSKSGMFKKGQTHKLNVVMTEGKDYVVKFYNSVPNNKVSYKVSTTTGDVLFSYDNIQLYKDLAAKEKTLAEKNKEKAELTDSKDEEEVAAFKKDMSKISKEVADLKAQVLKDRNTVPSCEFSITSTVSCEIEVTLVDIEPTTPTSCIGVLLMSKPGESSGFQDDVFTKAKKDQMKSEEAAKEKARIEAEEKARAEAEAKAKAEADKKKKKK